MSYNYNDLCFECSAYENLNVLVEDTFKIKNYKILYIVMSMLL